VSEDFCRWLRMTARGPNCNWGFLTVVLTHSNLHRPVFCYNLELTWINSLWYIATVFSFVSIQTGTSQLSQPYTLYSFLVSVLVLCCIETYGYIYIYVYIYMYESLNLWIYQCIYQSIHLSICLSTYPSISIYLYLSKPIYTSLNLYIYTSISIYIVLYPSISIYIYLQYIYLYPYLYLYLYL
jgi:hypothetical protein